MADPALNGGEGDILLDYEEEQEEAAGKEVQSKEATAGGDVTKKGFLGIHSTGFKDFLLKSELLKAIVDCGFEHPSEGALPTPGQCSQDLEHNSCGVYAVACCKKPLKWKGVS